MIIKVATISAVLAGIFVVALEVPAAQSRTTAKLHYDRVPAEATAPVETARYAQADAVVTKASASSECRDQAWPYVDASCMGAERRPVRTITIERRDAPNTSTLTREPVQAR